MIAAIVIAALGAVAVRVVMEGKTALADGDAALTGKRTRDAIASWESAARWYLPFAPHVDTAYARLRDATKSEHALEAWYAIRRAARATRSLWQPHADDLAAADAAIAQFAGAHPEAAPAGGKTVAERTAFQTARLAADGRPSRGAAALAVLGILCWLVGIGIVVVRGIDAAGKLVRRPTIVGAAVTVLGFVAWAAGLYNA